MCPAGRLIGGLKAVQFGDQPIPQRRRLIGGQNGLRWADQRCSALGARRSGPALSVSMPVRLLPIRTLRTIGSAEIRRIEVILSGNPHQGEQGVAPRIGQGCVGPSDAARRSR
jgi:hypothetical protein